MAGVGANSDDRKKRDLLCFYELFCLAKVVLMYCLLPQVGFEPNPLHKPELDSTEAALRKKPRTFLEKKEEKSSKKCCQNRSY
jgi:hypothetical protein